MAEWQTPKTDWAINPKNPTAEDFNRIEGNIDFLKQDIETKKGAIVNAINDMNQTADITNTYDELANKIRVISSDANAAVGDVLSGKTFYQGGLKRTGTMPNRGAAVITPSTTDQVIAAGYHNGNGYVKGDANLVSSNILSGKEIFGVSGNVFPRVSEPRLYVDGTEYVSFVKGMCSGRYWGAFKESNRIALTIRNSSEIATIVTDTRVDLTNVRYIVVDLSPANRWDEDYIFCLIASTNKMGSPDVYNAKASIAVENAYIKGLLLNVSNLSGNYYIRCSYGGYEGTYSSSIRYIYIYKLILVS